MPEAEEGDEGDESEGGFGVGGREGGGVHPGDAGEEFADGGADGLGGGGAHLAHGAGNPDQKTDGDDDGHDLLLVGCQIEAEEHGAEQKQKEGPRGGLGGGSRAGLLAGDEAETDDVSAECKAGQEGGTGPGILDERRGGGEVEQGTAGSHEEDGARPGLVIEIVGEDGEGEGDGDGDVGTSATDHHAGTAEQKDEADAPGGAEGDATGGDGALGAVLAVEGDVGGVIEDHAAGVEEGGSEGDPEQAEVGGGAAGEEPGGEHVGPDRGEVGYAGELEPGEEVGFGVQDGCKEFYGSRRSTTLRGQLETGMEILRAFQADDFSGGLRYRFDFVAFCSEMACMML